jgi:hypothetical protein
MTIEFLGFTLLLHEHWGLEGGLKIGRCWGIVAGGKAYLIIFSVITQEFMDQKSINS